MNWRALALAALCVGPLNTLPGPAAATEGAAAAETASRPAISWQSAGDSYSSGEGVSGNVGACAQSPQAYGPQTATALRARGWSVGSETFTACTGHLVEDYFNARPDSGKAGSLWEWGERDQGGPPRVDVITMSFGGNDIGFANYIADCLVGLPDSWREMALGGLASSLTGCDVSEADLRARIDALLDPPLRKCTGSRRLGSSSFDCDLDLGDRPGSIIDFYYDIVTERLTDRGQLVVVGYPKLFAHVDEWPAWGRLMCHGVKRGDTEKLGRLAQHLNSQVAEAVDRANEALPSRRVHYVDRLAIHQNGGHELCGTGEDWMNGIATSRGAGWSVRHQSSFHPNAAGHAAVSQALTPLLEETLPAAVPTRRQTGGIDEKDLRSLTLPAGHGCEYADDTFVGEVTLVGGEAESERGAFIALQETILTDLDGDDLTDGLLWVVCSSGAGGTSSSLFAMTADSRTATEVPYGPDAETQVDDVSVYRIETLDVHDGLLSVGAYGHRPGDSTAGPSARIVVNYQLGSPGLLFEGARLR